MKTKKEIIGESKGYFEAYPNEDEFYTIGDGNFFPSSQKSAASTYARQNKDSKLLTITRDEVDLPEDSTGTGKGTVTIPEGDPSKEWTKEELIAYGAKEFKELKLSKSMKEATILEKLTKAEEERAAGNSNETGGDKQDNSAGARDTEQKSNR